MLSETFTNQPTSTVFKKSTAVLRAEGPALTATVTGFRDLVQEAQLL